MAIGKEIKVTLSMDDAGFSVKAKNAGEVVKVLTAGLSEFSTTANKLDGSMSVLTKEMGSFSKGFGSVENTLKQLVSGMTTAAAELKSIGGSFASEFRRMDEAQQTSARVAKDSATAIVNAKLKTLQTEVSANDKLLASRGEMHAKLRKLESDTRAQSMAAFMKAEDAERRLGSFGGKNVINANLNDSARYEQTANAIRQEVAALDALIIKTREDQSARIGGIAALEAQRVAILENAAAEKNLASVAAAVGKSNAETVKKLTQDRKAADRERVASKKEEADESGRQISRFLAAQKQADRETVASAQQAAKERTRVLQEAAEQEKAQINQISEMWKGMAQMWAGAKIEKGLVSSVKAGDEAQRVDARVRALQLGSTAESQFRSTSTSIRDQVPQVSGTDASKIALAGLTGMGKFKPEILNEIMPTMAKSITNLAYLFPEMQHNIENSTRNALGLIEAMGATNNPAKMREIIETVQKGILASGGKLTYEDMETNARRTGMGNMPNIDPKALLDVMAFMNQMKVMGGAGGGGAGGISTSGVIERMVLNATSGKKPTKAAQSDLLELGVLEGDRVKKGDYAWKNSDQASANVFKYMSEFGEQAIKMMVENPKLRAKYFKNGENVKDENTQQVAFGRMLNRWGYSTNVVEGYKALANPHVRERMHNERELGEGSAGVENLDKALKGQYGRNMEKFNADITTLAATIGTKLLPVINPLIEGVTKFINTVDRVAKENPLAVQLSGIGAAFLGLNLGIKGFASMFGVVGGLSKLLTGVGGSATTAGAAVMTAGGQAATSGGLWSKLTGQVAGVYAPLIAADTKMKSAWTQMQFASATGSLTVGNSFKLVAKSAMTMAAGVGKAFLRMIPLLGELLLAWDFVQIVANLEVGGASVATWAISWGDRLLTTFKNVWIDITSLFSDGAGKAAAAAEKAANDAALKGRLIANGVEKAPDNTPKSAALRQLDEINSPGYSPLTAKHTPVAPVAPVIVKPPKPKLTLAAPDTSSAALAAQLDGESGGKGKSKHERNYEDALGKYVAGITERENVDRLKLGTVLNGEPSFEEQARSDFKKNWLSGNLDNGHGPEKRKFVGDKKYDPKKGWSEGDINYDQKVKVNGEMLSPNDIIKRIASEKQLEEQVKSTTFAKERAAAADEDQQAAMDRLTGNAAKETDAMRALNREFAREEQRNPNAKNDVATQLEKSKALAARASADLMNYAASFADSDKAARASMITNEAERIAAEQDAILEKEQDQYAKLLDEQSKYYNELLSKEAAGSEEYATLDAKFKDAQIRAEEAHNKHLKVLADQRAFAQRSPLQKMADDWKDTFKQIQDAEANWANGFLDTLNTFITTGKADVKSFLASILSDISKMLLKQSIGDSIQGAAGAAGNWLKKAMGVVDPTKPAAGAVAQSVAGGAVQGAATPGMGAALMNTLKTVWGGLTSIASKVSSAFSSLFSSTGNTTSGMTDLAGQGIAGMIGSATESVAQSVVQLSTNEMLALELEFLSFAASEAATALMEVAMSNMVGGAAFANGGIMTSAGSMPLKAYANGGIATSPQLALFGEGSMNEAYVPLPDGRSIPVTLKGAGGNASTDTAGGQPVSIVIQINEASGDESKSNSDDSDKAKAWGQIASRVKDVVREEMSVQQRPGGLLYR